VTPTSLFQGEDGSGRARRDGSPNRLVLFDVDRSVGMLHPLE
jgi:hypothetical protein